MASSMAIRPKDVVSPLLAGRLPSTPVNLSSPLIRRRGALDNAASLGKSPIAVGTGSSVLEINDDEKEKRDRRMSKMLEMQQRNLNSPATPADRRQSLPLSGLNNAQLAEHYADCIKLSAENKISAKNAFGLHLIDYMSELFKKKDITDFQLASSTLDASAKIYAGRVDAIHTEMYKVLCGLGRGSSNSQKTADDQEDGLDEVKDGEDGQAGVEEVEKKRKRARKSHTVETNLKNITMSKFDLESELDPTLQKIPNMSDEGGTSCLLLNQLRCFDDSSEVILDFSTIVTSESSHAGDGDQSKEDRSIDVRSLSEICSSAGFEALPICTAFSDFEFMNWNADSNSEDVVKTAMDRLGKNVHVFDLDAEPEQMNTDNVNDGADEDVIDDGFGPIDDADDDYDNADDVKVNQATLFGAGQGKQAELLETAIASIRNGEIGSLIQVLASEPSDYSYFKTDLMRTWAGPEHWKLQPKIKAETGTAGEKTKSKKSKSKEPFTVTFDENVDLEWHFKVTKAATTVTKTTLDKHTKQQTTLPDDLHYDAKQLLKLFTMPSLMVKWQANNATAIEVDKYNYDNANDKIDYCPGVQINSNMGDMDAIGGADNDDNDDNDENDVGGIDFNLTAGDDVTRSQFPLSQFSEGSQADGTFFTGDNMVTVPRKIAKIDIDYAKVAKRIDVKRLKTTMWDVITEHCSSSATANVVSSPVPSTQAKEQNVMFQGLFGEVTSRVSSMMAKNLSVPIMFVCLLHLANEKTLKISNSDNMTDLRIELENR